MKDFTYGLRKSHRKNLSIYVERDGSVLVKAPKNLPHEKIDEIVKRKEPWIYRSLAEFQELNRTQVKREIIDGEGFLFMGRSYRLKIEEGLKRPLLLNDGHFMLDAREAENAREHFIDFYKQRGKEHIPERVHQIDDKLGVNPRTIRVMNLRNRWASRTQGGVNFHWKVMLAPMTVIDYVIVHELAHYVKPDHGSEFWDLVGSVMPDYHVQKAWLRSNGANLDI
jgi:predicted metal-dependent hydrolase